ncbi:MAG TPA: cation-translocating P-type ATPase [Anaerolineae bacterium]|nr:cation-translocating P-type ATPase [Anaerolineae bacterium]
MTAPNSSPQTDWHLKDSQAILSQFNVDPQQGLDTATIEKNRAKYGPNKLDEHQLKSPWLILWEQFTEVMVIVLIVAALISLALGEYKDVIAIMTIVILNAALGFFQEYRAERAMAALQELANPTVRVRRKGKLMDVESWELVPGDIILVEAGSKIPADSRLVEAVNLRAQEASLTGESEPVNKTDDTLTGEHLPVADRSNMIYLGTAVTYGRGTAVVVETGMSTELGRIAELIQNVETDQTPLQKRMDELGRKLAVIALGIVGVVFVVGFIGQEADIQELFLTAIAMAVAAIPEGLPAVVTIALALGAQRMLKREALVRKLPAVETLGSVTVICSDKTGTLTQNQMTVRMLDVVGDTINLSQLKDDGHPAIHKGDKPLDLDKPSQALLLVGGALCNDATLTDDEDSNHTLVTIGDPTEGALLVAAAQFGYWKDDLDQQFPRVAEVPFSSERKRMTTVHKVDQETIAQLEPALASLYEGYSGQYPYAIFTKGAVDGLLDICNRVWADGQVEEMNAEWRQRIEEANRKTAEQGLRVLGLAMRITQELPENNNENEFEQRLVFVGLASMIDPPRPEVKEAVQTCRHAGIRPVMITGDHPLTALAIAHELNITDTDDILTGRELSQMSTQELEDAVETVSVYARVSPEHKLNIVQALQSKGHIVAMTGDGVNDAPALRKSDIGVAMGITGTDVSKEAANMVILDDNFATIVRAVKEGRTIYDNVRKFMKYTMSSNAGEIYVMLFGPFIGLGLPLSAIQILWINLVTDGLPGLALAVEPSESNTMDRPPHPPDESIFARGMGRHILWVGLLMGAVCLLIGRWGLNNNFSDEYWKTLVFTTLTLSQMGHALAVRSGRDSLFTQGLLSNRPLLGAVALTFILQMGVLYVPIMADFFDTLPLQLPHLLLCLIASTVVFWAVEIEKWLIRNGHLNG